VRIISGRYRSRQLKTAPAGGIRPTSDKLRETLFNVLGDAVNDSTFLDGCAGMGGIGLEALSREAALVYFVDRSPKACRIIRENLDILQVKEGYKILELDLIKALDLFQRNSVRFDIAFLDPPYDREDLYEGGLERFASGSLLVSGGLLIFEHSKRAKMPESVGHLRQVRCLAQGDSVLAFYRVVEAS
jgi:16S rRNA (guanine(966)-N(2))-methyltransferase RsmD